MLSSFDFHMLVLDRLQVTWTNEAVNHQWNEVEQVLGNDDTAQGLAA